jgi:acyl-CoA reductase-like NAD-dependent aldehyde dehydrogenase
MTSVAAPSTLVEISDSVRGFLASSPQHLLIGGEWLPANSGAVMNVVNPANGELLTRVAQADETDADRVVEAASDAFENPEWRWMPANERGRLLYRMAELVAERAADIAQAETLNVGKPLFQAEDDVETVVDCFRYYAGAARLLEGATPAVPTDFFSYTLHEPIGVCVGIVPWNFPFQIAAWKVAPALAAGNTVILKPASRTPLSALMLGQIGLEAGLPPGVLNVVTGPGALIGQALASHPAVGKISLTGETRTGERIMQLAAQGIKRLSLELGGKSPSLIFPDADLDQAVTASLTAIYFNAGQMCAARSRIIVHEDIHQEFVGMMADRARRLRLGNPMDRATHMGPMISRDQVETVEGFVQSGLKEGATLLAGGGRPDDPELQRGHFYLPTIFDNVSNSMRIAREEIFGPVASVIPFRTEEEGVRLANETSYGLAATIWTGDVKRAHRVARQVRAGGVWINTNMTLFNETPFGGYKASGMGRELGLESLLSYTEVKHVGVFLGERVRGFNLG